MEWSVDECVLKSWGEGEKDLLGAALCSSQTLAANIELGHQDLIFFFTANFLFKSSLLCLLNI